MSQIVEFRLESGEIVYVESREMSFAGPLPASRGAAAIKKSSATFEAALERVKPAAKAVVEAFRELNEPDEMTLEFGIEFKSAANAFVVTGEASASFKLSLKWKSSKT